MAMTQLDESGTTTRIPAAALWLGVGGLRPFIGLAALTAMDYGGRAQWAHALAAYGATILAFVGALHWGVAMMQPGRAGKTWLLMGWSVVPALIGWVALLLDPAQGLALLLAGFALHQIVDLAVARRERLPGWYLPLRISLSSVAAVSLFVALRQMG
jgi:hypothetical protein